MGIEKEIIALSSGDDETVSQFFFKNTFVEHCECTTSPFSFDVPLYALTGATDSYYTQDTRGISTNLNNIKSVKYEFTANTHSLSGTTELVYDIYKLEYPTFESALNNTTLTTGLTTVETSTGSTQVVTATTASISDIQTILENPFYTFKESASAITLTNNVYVLSFPQIIKPVKQFAQDLFLDKGQYFFDTRYEFDKFFDPTLGDLIQFSSDTNSFVSIPRPKNNLERVTTEPGGHSITGGTFSGVTVYGSFFSYFKVPNKPNINVINDAPSVIGVLDTYTPIFSFNNVDDGDYYKLNVSYDVENDEFTGNTTVFAIPKQIGDAEFIRTFAVSLTPNVEFIYRIGNSKEIINIFGIKQNVTVWGSSATGETANNGYYQFKGKTYQNFISPTTTLSSVTINLSLSFTSSSVDLGADSPEDENISPALSSALETSSAPVTITSDANGNFDFGIIKGGIYTFTASHPSFYSQTFLITIGDDTDLDVLFNILWGNEIITFSYPMVFG